MAEPPRLMCPALFGVAAISFLLPFATVSCHGPVAGPEGVGPGTATQTGLQMAMGTGPSLEIKPGVLEGLEVDRRIFERDPEPLAVVALGSGLLGVAVGFGMGRPWRVAGGIIAIAGVIALVVLRAELRSDLTAFGRPLGFQPDEVDEVFALQYRAGYWLALTAFVSAAMRVAVSPFVRRWRVIPPRGPASA